VCYFIQISIEFRRFISSKKNSDINKLRLSLFRTANLLQIWKKHLYLYFISLVLTFSDERLKSIHVTNRDFLCFSVRICVGTMFSNWSEDFFSLIKILYMIPIKNHFYQSRKFFLIKAPIILCNT